MSEVTGFSLTTTALSKLKATWKARISRLPLRLSWCGLSSYLSSFTRMPVRADPYSRTRKRIQGLEMRWYRMLLNISYKDHLGRTIQKRVFGHMRIAKARISLRIRAVWSGPSLSDSRIIWYCRMYGRKAKAAWYFAHEQDKLNRSKALFRLTRPMWRMRKFATGSWMQSEYMARRGGNSDCIITSRDPLACRGQFCREQWKEQKGEERQKVEEAMRWQYQGMGKLGDWNFAHGSGRQGKMENNCCKIISGALTNDLQS